MKIERDKLSRGAAGGNLDTYFNAMFGAAPNEIQELSLDRLTPFEGQPFKPYTEEKLRELADDIARNGILSPVIVRPLENTFQILAGHNRVNAAKLAGLMVAPCIVKDVDDDTARLIMINTNLNQREELLPSEKAFAYKMQLDTMKRQGARTDLTSGQFVQKLPGKNSIEIVADQAGENYKQIQRYIRLTELTPPLLDMVDEKKLPLLSGVYLSYCTASAQQQLLGFMRRRRIATVKLEQAQLIKLHKDALSDAALEDIFGSSGKKASGRAVGLKIPAEYLTVELKKGAVDDELLRRVAETVNRYLEEKNN